jgi:hypothetical protein
MPGPGKVHVEFMVNTVLAEALSQYFSFCASQQSTKVPKCICHHLWGVQLNQLARMNHNLTGLLELCLLLSLGQAQIKIVKMSIL